MQLGAVAGGGVIPVAEVKQLDGLAVGGGSVQVHACLDQFPGGVPAVFLPVAAGLPGIVEGKGCGTGVQPVHILIVQQVDQVVGVDILVNIDRHGVQRQGKLQHQVPAGGHRPRLADLVDTGENGHQTGGAALGDAGHQHIRPGNAPLGQGAVAGADLDRHRALVVQRAVRVGLAGERVDARLGCRRRGGRHHRSALGGGFRRGYAGGCGRFAAQQAAAGQRTCHGCRKQCGLESFHGVTSL